ncbi:MAG: Rne/Rng family ribonuclease [Brachybacterium sp.]|nr:Rne/Rng family ribonuclease [Brachybacterium sp.]
MASTRGSAASAAEESADDRASRREQVQMDFASLLFQAPIPQPRTTVGGQDSAEVAGTTDSAAGESERTEDEDSPEEERSSRSRRSRSRSRRSSQRDEGTAAESRDDSAEADVDDSTDEDGSEDRSSGGGSGSSRRRRRRGGRGRRGRGRGEDDGAEGSEGDDDAQDDSADSSPDDAGRESSGSGPDAGGESSSGSSSSRRRRRRRRSGGGSDDSGSVDDPPNTVVKVREARDEVKAVKGSTRLEAKRQRRREGRDNGRKRNVITEAEFLARRESVKRSMVVRERPGRTQIAVLEDDVLVEHYVAQKSQTSMVGNVYMGKVQNVLPSMEAAFVDIGKGRNAVLYAGEVNWDAVGLEGQPRRIELALKSGDPVLVQVTKDPIGHKGARLTSQISLPGRYVVFVTGGTMTGISRKLPDTERARLKKIMRQIIPEDAGVIVRTASEGASEEELTRDVERLRAQWDKIQKAQKSKSAPASLSQEPDIAIKVVRDVFNEDFTSLIVEGDKVYDDVHSYVSEVAPDLLERVTKHVGEKDVFAKHRIDEQLLKAMDRKVYLPSGGSLVIDRTEAMTVVDVNTGKFTGSGGSLEETVTKNNIESAEEIVRQLRLRDIGGIIVIDFIDMVLESNRDLVLRRLVECLGRDRTKHQVAEVTSLGLVQMTRKRVGQGLVETFSTTCEHCHGRGLVVDAEGEHHHGGGGHDGEDSSKSSRRRGGRRSRGGAKDEGEGSDHGAGENGGDVHRLEGDETSRAQARATIASIAAASGSTSQADSQGEEAASTTWEQDAPEQG